MKLKKFINSKSGSYDVMHEAATILKQSNYSMDEYNKLFTKALSNRNYNSGTVRNYRNDPIRFFETCNIILVNDDDVKIINDNVFNKYLESYSTALGAHAYSINKKLISCGVPITDLMNKFYNDNNLEELFIEFVTHFQKEAKYNHPLEDIINAFKTKDTDKTKHHMRRMSFAVGYNNFVNGVNKWCTTSQTYKTPKNGLSYELATNKKNGKRQGFEFDNSYIDTIDESLVINTYNYLLGGNSTIEIDLNSTEQFENDLKEYFEGETKSQLVEKRLRNSKIVIDIKSEHKRNNNGRLPCTSCGKCFSDDGFVPYIEAHHEKPFSDNKGIVKIHKDDFELLCPNCHRERHLKKK